MFNLEVGKTYDIWVNGVFMPSVKFTKFTNDKAVFIGFSIRQSAIDAVRKI